MKSNQLVIRLNLDALNALFPDGSEARVQLQNSVLAQAAGQYVKGQLTDEVKGYLDNAVSKVAVAVDLDGYIASSFARKQGWGSKLDVKEGSAMASAIAERVRFEFDRQHDTAIYELIQKRAEEITRTLDSRIERTINDEVIRRANKRIQERVQQALNTAVQSIDQSNG